MRCSLGGTSSCKVHQWVLPLQKLREILLELGLEETMKWGVPCYMKNSKNVLLLSAFKEHCAISFFKGGLIEDRYGLLRKPGPNSHASRVLLFKSMDEVNQQKDCIVDYVQQAIKIELTEQKPVKFDITEPIPELLLEVMEAKLEFKEAFYKLSKSKQRGYLIYFNQPKNAETIKLRIAKCEEKILQGKGLHD